MKARRTPSFLPWCFAAIALAATGCTSLVQGIVEGQMEEPYREALKQGRMSPHEYQKAKEAIREGQAPKS